MCWKCGKEQDFSASVYRDSTCSACGADLHSCRGCAFYAPGSHFDCRETVEEIVVEKERANFCEHFRAGLNSKWNGTQGQNGPVNGATAADKARDAFNNLFG
ncbi:MAG: hypothetical protein IK015_02735 [Treponema sp.]|nr:hypothetical protein [Treponema sp.]